MNNLTQPPNVLQRVIELNQRVHAVELLFDEDLPIRPAAIKISFQTTSLWIAVRAEDDTIIISECWPNEYEGSNCNVVVADGDVYRLLPNCNLVWGWFMQNHLGYLDGVQLEFKREDETSVCIQWIALASTLELRVVSMHHQSRKPTDSAALEDA